MQTEKNYDFRKRMLEVHKPNLRRSELRPCKQELELTADFRMILPADADEVVRTAAGDFADFLRVSMGLQIGTGGNVAAQTMVLSLAADAGVTLEQGNGYSGFRVEVTADRVMLYGFDSRGLAQALYYLEDIMTLRCAPFLPWGIVEKKPLYSPMMVHSGYGSDCYPEGYLSALAHEGRDAILITVKESDLVPNRFMEYNDLIRRAARYGIGVYAYSAMESKIHPEDTGAEAYYEGTYGKLFQNCPGLKGVTLVGESIFFPSKDPCVAPTEKPVDGIPDGRPSSSGWPCVDYPQLLSLFQKVIYRYAPNADIVFWSYNWGWRPEAERRRLIEALPKGVSLLATFEMTAEYQLEGQGEFCADYTIARAEPGFYFLSEAQAAKENGVRLYSMTNTGGKTWDFGAIPYEPFPYQWIKRFREMERAHDQWGLCGLMESHNYGVAPSMISKLAKWAFYGEKDLESVLERMIAAQYSPKETDRVLRGLALWSEGITHYTPTDEDQYGAFRVGPSYPFCLDETIRIPTDSGREVHTCFPSYWTWADNVPRAAMTSTRIPVEIRSLGRMKERMEQGIAEIESVSEKNEALERLLCLGKFILRCVETGIRAKRWHMLKCGLRYEQSKAKLTQILDEMEQILREEHCNAEATIPLVQMDSHLGWVSCEGYTTDATRLQWKMRQVDYVLQTEIPRYRKAVELTAQI